MNYCQIFKIPLYLSHREDLRLFEFIPKVSPLFSLVLDVSFSGVLQEEGASYKGTTEAGLLYVEGPGQLSICNAVCFILGPWVGLRTVPGHLLGSVPGITENHQVRNAGLQQCESKFD